MAASGSLDPVTRLEHEMHQQTCKERFEREKERLQKLEDLTASLGEVSLKLSIIVDQQEKKSGTQDTQISKQNERITTLEQKPGRRWDTVVNDVLKIILGGVIVFLLAKFGIK